MYGIKAEDRSANIFVIDCCEYVVATQWYRARISGPSMSRGGQTLCTLSVSTREQVHGVALDSWNAAVSNLHMHNRRTARHVPPPSTRGAN